MDKFFTQKNCDRCGGSLECGRTMSMYNKDCICMACYEKEKQRPDYNEAVETDHAEIKRGNYNFEGIGYSQDGEITADAQEIELTMKAYSKEELARKHVLLTKDVMRVEAENKKLKAELAQATLKQTPRKPRKESLADRDCPSCGAYINFDALNDRVEDAPPYCAWCGQALDWRED